MPVGRRGSLLPAVLNNGQTTRSATAERVTDLRRTTPATTGACAGECGWSVAVVLAAFIVHCIVDGVGYSFAVFYVDLLDEFTAQNHAKVVLVGTLLPATCLFVGPLVGALTNKLGCRLVTVCGSVLAAVGVGASSFCSHINMLIATYGLLAGLGFGMMHLPSIIIVSFYFTRRRALVTAIVLCGSGVGKFLFAPLTRYLMDRYGWRGANCILAAIILHGAACGCAFRPLRACSAARPPPSRRPAGCVMMQKTVDETRRRRRDSTCSLDGRVITSDGRLLAAHDDDRTTASRQPSSRLQSAGRPRTLSDSASTDPSWLVRPCSQPGRQLPTGHRCGFVDGRLSGGSSSDARRSRTRTVSEPVSLSPGASLRHSAVCTGDQCRLTLDGPVDLLSSATLPRTASAEVLETSDRVMTSVPDVETVERRSSQTSSINPAVWVTDRNASVALNCGGVHVELPELNAIEMTDLSERTGGVSLNRPASTSRSDTRAVSALVSSRPDIFYSGSCLQVNSDGGRSVAMTSSDDRKCCHGDAEAGPLWSMLRLMLDVSLLGRVSFVVLAVSILLCYLGLFTSFMYIVDHAMQLGVSKTRAAMLLSLLGASSVVSRLAVGCVADMPSVDSVALYTVALWVAGASTCTLPSLRSYQLLCGYQLVYGACCAVFVTLKSILVVDLLGLDKLTTAYGILSLLEGVGTLAGTPLIGGLYDVTYSYSWSFIVAGSLLLLAGVICIPLRRLERWQHWRNKRRRTAEQRPLANVVRNAI